MDDFDLSWSSFRDCLASRLDDAATFLVELRGEVRDRRSWTVGEWRRDVERTAACLRDQGIERGSVVAALAGNTADALLLAYGCWLLGACYVPLNAGDRVERHSYVVSHSSASLLVHSPEMELQARGIERSDSVALLDTARLSLLREAALDPDPSPVPAAGLGLAALRIYTSGTTGAPKGVVLTTRNLLTDCDGLARALGWPAETRMMTVLPIHHVNGLLIGSLLPWVNGHSTVLRDRFRASSFWDDARLEGATVSSVVPTLLEFLLGTEPPPGPALREVLCGAGPLLSETAITFEDTFGIPVRHLYGLSETTAVVTLMPSLSVEERRRWHRDHPTPSIGPAIPHVEVDVHDAAGESVADGVTGELVVRGAVVMREYADMGMETEQALRGGWFRSGDQGCRVRACSGEPYFFITGRLKEVIVRGGVNISPVEIDAVLRRHKAVRFALAVPFENRFYGEEIAAYVSLASPVSDAEIHEHCAKHLEFGRRPKVIIRGDEVPFTSTGKPQRLELAQRLAEELLPYREVQFRPAS